MTFHRIGRLLLASTALLAATLVLSACGSSNDDDGAGSTAGEHGSGHSTATGAGNEVAGLGNGTDLAFVSQMIPHHESAIEMAEIAKERSSRNEIRALADDIIAAQEAEIDELTDLKDELTEGGVKAGSLGLDDEHMGMGMDASALENADPFDREFIDMMTPHHEGAIAMARVELDRGISSHGKEIATAIISAQEREIAQMADWRETWFGGGV